MAHILVPTDFSTNAFNAASYALELYGAEGNTFTLLHAYVALMDPALQQLQTTAGETEEIQHQMDALIMRLNEARPRVKLDLRKAFSVGDVYTGIATFSDDEGAPDLVVMGTQGASGLEEVLLGTHTADVIKHSRVPVLTVPEEAKYTTPRRIILADDGGPVDRSSIKVLLDIARWSHSEIKIVRVVQGEGTSDTEANDSPYEMILGAIPRSFHTVSGANVEHALNTMAYQSDADMVVVMHRHRSIFSQLFHRSTAAKLAMHTHIPMLVLQQDKH